MTLWNIETTRTQVDTVLLDFFATQKSAASKLDTDYQRLWEVTEAFATAGGKRLRPYLLLLAYQSYAGTNSDSALQVATAQELLHLCLLIHDDIIDRDYRRYGVDNIAGSYKKLYASPAIPHAITDHLADGAALLAGDVLLSSAYSMIAASQLTANQISIAHGHLHQAMFQVAGGELLDTEAVLQNIEAVDTTKIMQLKTAQYSFITPLVCGAELAGASVSEVDLLREFGRNMGIAYQLADDIVGVFGNEAVTGKSSSSDLQESKRTFLLQQTLQMADPATKKYLQATIGFRKVSDHDITRIRTIIIDSGALVHVQKLIGSYGARSAKIVSQLTIDQQAKQQLKLLTTKIVDTTQRSISRFSG